MSIFSNILAKLGFGRTDAPSPGPASPTGAAPTAAPAGSNTPAATAPAVQAISLVDVVTQLESAAASNPEKLNWKTSIVDLLKLLGLDSSFNARKELATELHCPADKMSDSAAMNIWLHQTVLQKLAQNGGNIPADLLH